MGKHFNPYCEPPWLSSGDPTFVDAIERVYRNEEIVFGAGAPDTRTSAEIWGDMAVAAIAAITPPTPVKNIEPAPAASPEGRFRGRRPSEYEAMPPLEFWDDAKTLPRFPGGAVVLLYGDWGSHKTNTVLTMMLDAILGRGARVCYAAGEGAYGVGKERIPAHCRARGIATNSLDNKLRIVPAVPLFADPEQTAAFIGDQGDFRPDIVVIDTLATAIAGTEENGSQASAFLTDNGPVGTIKRAFGALVVLPAHSGKDEKKGARGHSGFSGNADVILHIEAHDSGAIRLKVEKMRDGADGFAIYFKAPPKGSAQIPVPVRITEADYKALVGTPPGRRDEAQSVFNLRRGLLVEKGAVSFQTGISERHLAEFSAGPRPGGGSLEDERQWETSVETERKALQNAHVKTRYRDVLCREEVPTGGTKLQWRWYVVEPTDADLARAGESEIPF